MAGRHDFLIFFCILNILSKKRKSLGRYLSLARSLHSLEPAERSEKDLVMDLLSDPFINTHTQSFFNIEISGLSVKSKNNLSPAHCVR